MNSSVSPWDSCSAPCRAAVSSVLTAVVPTATRREAARIFRPPAPQCGRTPNADDGLPEPQCGLAGRCPADVQGDVGRLGATARHRARTSEVKCKPALAPHRPGFTREKPSGSAAGPRPCPASGCRAVAARGQSPPGARRCRLRSGIGSCVLRTGPAPGPRPPASRRSGPVAHAHPAARMNQGQPGLTVFGNRPEKEHSTCPLRNSWRLGCARRWEELRRRSAGHTSGRGTPGVVEHKTIARPRKSGNSRNWRSSQRPSRGEARASAMRRGPPVAAGRCGPPAGDNRS